MSRSSKPARPPADADRKRRFRETARNILRMDRVKRQFREAVDTAGAMVRAMEQAYRLGFEEALKDPAASKPSPVAEERATEIDGESGDAMTWAKIPPRRRNTFLEHLSRCTRSHGTHRDAELSRAGTGSARDSRVAIGGSGPADI